MRALVLILSIALTSVSTLAASTGSMDPAAAGAVSPDAAISSASIAGLRSRGPAGLELLLGAYAADIERVRRGEGAPENWERLRAALDTVAGQRDAYAAGLYWYTDIDAARAASKSSGRPILSLRLLGRLDEEYSCANSRFFRTALYANPRVAEFLRNNFVLHWSSERPAPKITIDFGDGRTLVRTITGNSAHYVLDEQGRVVDVLPGLCGPQAFVRELGPAIAQARKLAAADMPEWISSQRRYVAAQLAMTQKEWDSAIASLGGDRLPAIAKHVPEKSKPRRTAPPAGVATTAAVTKAAVEIPMLQALDLYSNPSTRTFDDAIWPQVAAMRPDDARLDDGALSMVRKHVTPGTSADEVAVIVSSFEMTMAIDTVRSRFAMRPQILARLDALWAQSSDSSVASFDAANRLVYDDVFMTPESDPWLGLSQSWVYTALENGGVR